MKSSAEPRAAADDVDVELLKAVAQAWHAQSGNPRPSRASEPGGDDDAAGALPRAGAGAAPHRPSRFKLEAMAAAAAAAASDALARERSWDFARSLWDTYELVSVARKLESGLVIADHAAAAPAVPEGAARGAGKRNRESGRSLRSLFLRSSSRRFEKSSS
ncbi:uncharacterized protein LOC133920490 [Phragmites australis]|uniref:uncharacterized protein LOC133920490 n=1 Tax=Phragmites australis TaxID=29695 RepID=UPI002D76A5BA|nr:uncharacterized protein LOC133920490 [Phragmites australis]